jgi:hypothetical protein
LGHSLVQCQCPSGAQSVPSIIAFSPSPLPLASVHHLRVDRNERRRIILQQRIRVQPDDQGRLILDTIAPTPASALVTGGRVSIAALLPWEDEDVKPQILTGDGETTQGFEFEQGRVKQRPWVAWHWKNDPVFRLAWPLRLRWDSKVAGETGSNRLSRRFSPSKINLCM